MLQCFYSFPSHLYRCSWPRHKYPCAQASSWWAAQLQEEIVCFIYSIILLSVQHSLAWPHSVVQLDLEWLACPTIEPLQWIALARSTSVQEANPQKAGPLHNARTGQPLTLAQTSHTTMQPLTLASAWPHAEQREGRTAKLLRWADSCLSAVNCLWQSRWPHFRGLSPGFPPLSDTHVFLTVITPPHLPPLPPSSHACLPFYCIRLSVCIPLLSAPHAWPGYPVILSCCWHFDSRAFWYKALQSWSNTVMQHNGLSMFYRQQV